MHLRFIIMATFIWTASLTAQPRIHSKPIVKSLPETPTAQQIKIMEADLINSINLERKKHHLPPLRLWAVLSTYAKDHSWNIALDHIEFGHHGFEERADAVKNFGQHIGFGENVAYSYMMEDPIKAAVEGWMRSKGHRENIFGDYNETGVGIAYSKEGRCYITQLFAKRIQKR